MYVFTFDVFNKSTVPRTYKNAPRPSMEILGLNNIMQMRIQAVGKVLSSANIHVNACQSWNVIGNSFQ